MKRLSTLLLLLGCGLLPLQTIAQVFGQNVYVNQSDLNSGGTQYYQASDAIYSPSNGSPAATNPNTTTIFEAGKTIFLDQGFSAGPYTGNHKFLAIANPWFDGSVVLEPTPINGAVVVPRYDKLEIGLAPLPALQEKVDLFLDNYMAGGTDGLNPYDPEDINIYAIFDPDDGGTERKVYGFHYIGIQRTVNGPDLTGWTQVESQYPFRIRFAPTHVGGWNVRIYCEIQGGEPFLIDQFDMTCDNNLDNPGYVNVGPDKRYFQFDQGGTYFPIGISYTPKSNCEIGGFGGTAVRYNSGMILQDMIQQTADHNGNFVALFLQPIWFDIEWEHLSVYANRQNIAWELDEALELAENAGVYICIKNIFNSYNFNGQTEDDGTQKPLSWYEEEDFLTGRTDDYGDYYADYFGTGPLEIRANPYNRAYIGQELGGDPYNPIHFFNHTECRKKAKNKIRYFLARWGYSTHVAYWTLFKELELTHNDNNNNNHQNWMGLHKDDLVDWFEEMQSYMYELDPNHEVNMSFGKASKKAWIDEYNDGYEDILELPGMRIAQEHDYHIGPDRNHIRNRKIRRLIERFDKPAVIGEMGLDFHQGENEERENCLGDELSLHNDLWATSFSGSMPGTAFWGEKMRISGWLNVFRPLAAFFDGLNLNRTGDDRFYPIGSVDFTYPPYQNGSYNQLYGYGDGDFNGKKKVRTPNSNIVEVMAIRSDLDDDIFGWMHNMTYNYAHSTRQAAPVCGPDGHPDYDVCWDPGDERFDDFQPVEIASPEIKFENMGSNQEYTVEFWSTWGNGGLISTATATANWTGDLTVTYDRLYAHVTVAEDEYPDVAFRIFRTPGKKAADVEKPGMDEPFLGQNFPNPHTGQTTIPYRIAKPGNVSLRISDLTGRVVKELVNNPQHPAGDFEVSIDGFDLSDGVYMYTLQADQYITTKLMTKQQ